MAIFNSYVKLPEGKYVPTVTDVHRSLAPQHPAVPSHPHHGRRGRKGALRCAEPSRKGGVSLGVSNNGNMGISSEYRHIHLYKIVSHSYCQIISSKIKIMSIHLSHSVR